MKKIIYAFFVFSVLGCQSNTTKIDYRKLAEKEVAQRATSEEVKRLFEIKSKKYESLSVSELSWLIRYASAKKDNDTIEKQRFADILSVFQNISSYPQGIKSDVYDLVDRYMKYDEFIVPCAELILILRHKESIGILKKRINSVQDEQGKEYMRIIIKKLEQI